MSNMKKSWTIEETVVLIYFTSFRVTQEACKALIQQKCHSKRDLGSIRGKVISVRNAVLQAGNPSLYDSKTKIWNRNNVDAWIAANGKHLANIKHLIRFGEFEQKLIKSQHQNRLKDLISRSQKQIDSRSQSSLALPLQAAANISPHQLLEGVGNCNNPHSATTENAIALSSPPLIDEGSLSNNLPQTIPDLGFGGLGPSLDSSYVAQPSSPTTLSFNQSDTSNVESFHPYGSMETCTCPWCPENMI